ncbi:MAG: hypothetical protein QNI87_10075 [Erythrobacter sp.]|uniref:hypothetical protein n=1 Tax=Erythrobacter sp. TaxID=1042 RepID=UPI00262E1E3F|nr:hypothetical protein [Erythrobacter sp.]MDJ0978874.1 hypothetical protein [Erythrobacter sp.]
MHASSRLCPLALIAFAPALGLALARTPAAASQPQELSSELRLEGLDTIEVLVNGVPTRLEVNPSASGPILINPDIAEKAKLRASDRLTYDFGEYQVPTYVTNTSLNFGSEPRKRRVTWTKIAASNRADGVIGVQHLPYDRVTFVLGEPSASERVQRFPLKRKGRPDFLRIGTDLEVADKKLFAVFALGIEPNLVSASTANFLATHQEGGFVEGSENVVEMAAFAMRRPTKDMRLAYPLELGDLQLDTFAVRVNDHGKANKVGNIDENDPRFVDGAIVVSRRKGRGKPDVVTRIGRSQIAHCSRLTFDLAADVIELSCALK